MTVAVSGALVLSISACTLGASPAPPASFQPGAIPESPRADRTAVGERESNATRSAGAERLPAPRPAASPADEPPRPRAEVLLSPEMAASPAAARLIRVITAVKDSLVTTSYQHRTRVQQRKGRYDWDCSGMAEWMLKRSAPRALQALDKDRPRAIHFYRGIARAPKKQPRRGWQQLEHVSDARPGDVFAFPRSAISTSRVTGHVGFFVETPWRVAGVERAWAARIVDSTRTPHQDDTRIDDDDGGFGFGTMMFIQDESGQTIAYGWYGTRSAGYMPTHVVYGRVTR